MDSIDQLKNEFLGQKFQPSPIANLFEDEASVKKKILEITGQFERARRVSKRDELEKAVHYNTAATYADKATAAEILTTIRSEEALGRPREAIESAQKTALHEMLITFLVGKELIPSREERREKREDLSSAQEDLLSRLQDAVKPELPFIEGQAT